jgi:hypothetical protein
MHRRHARVGKVPIRARTRRGAPRRRHSVRNVPHSATMPEAKRENSIMRAANERKHKPCARRRDA